MKLIGAAEGGQEAFPYGRSIGMMSQNNMTPRANTGRLPSRQMTAQLRAKTVVNPNDYMAQNGNFLEKKSHGQIPIIDTASLSGQHLGKVMSIGSDTMIAHSVLTQHQIKLNQKKDAEAAGMVRSASRSSGKS